MVLRTLLRRTPSLVLVSGLLLSAGTLGEDEVVFRPISMSTSEEVPDLIDEDADVPREIASLGVAAENTWLKQQLRNLRERVGRVRQEGRAPPYVMINGRRANLAWKNTHGKLKEWTVPIDEYRTALQRRKPSRTISLIGEGHARFKVVDFRPFVDVAPFEKLARRLYDEAGSDAAFVNEAVHTVRSLTTYIADEVETPRWPLETLIESGGDCEDTAILMASLILASGRPFNVEFVYFDIKRPQIAGDVNHVALRVTMPDGHARFIETTTKAYSDYKIPRRINGWYFSI